MIQTDNIYNSASSASIRHHSSGKQNIEFHHDIKDKKPFEARHDLKNDKKDGTDREQIRKQHGKSRFKTEISSKGHDEKKEQQGTGGKETADAMAARKSSYENFSASGQKIEKKLINIGNTFKELRKAIDNLKTQSSSSIVSNKSISEKNSLHRISLQSDPSVSYPVTREQKILASLVTGDVKPSVREDKDKKDIKKNNTSEVREEDIKGNTVRGRFVRQGRKEKKNEGKINYFFNPIIPREDSKKKLEEYLNTKYSSARVKVRGEKKSSQSALSPGVSSGLKKNDGLSKNISLQSPLSRFLNHNDRTNEKQTEKPEETPSPGKALKAEAPFTHSMLQDEKPEPLKTGATTSQPVVLAAAGPTQDGDGGA